MKKTVVVGMSGGVDSSLTAALLKEQGFDVVGLFMKNWEEKDENGVCKASLEFEDVERVCRQLDIPFYSVNFVKEYQEHVFKFFLEEYEKGYTPNPDILCNREIKFKVLLDRALQLGGDFLATGHYCRTNSSHLLLKGLDPGKDQSYFLHAVKSEQLSKVLFPVGELHKAEVRKLALERGLATHDKKDSTGICFIGERNFKGFLSQYLKKKPGPFSTLDGQIVGEHDGVAYYTIGQRKGMGIGGAGEAWFVLDKDVSKNIVYVGQGTRHPGLYCDELVATEVTWISMPPPSIPLSCKSKIRYRQPDQACTITRLEGDRLWVRFSTPQRAVTPRQSIVFYMDDVCLGGAMIERRGPSYYELNKPLPLEVST